MQGLSNAQPTLLSAAWPASTGSFLRQFMLALAGTALLTLSAKIQVPFYPVPMTMQTFVVLVIGMAFGWRLGAATLVLYLAEGAFGLPVFAGTPAEGIGLAYMAGPTGGYLIGFAVAAAFVGYLAERGWDRTLLKTLAAMVAGTALIFIFGYIWLAYLIGLQRAFQFGVLPFMEAAVFKIALAAAVLPLCWRFLARMK
ncbi:MAG: biotin transporter BioY [Hyphomicrobiales bacterium]|nr:biotin transporter BioY [Hyphomicrobiales bacterium]